MRNLTQLAALREKCPYLEFFLILIVRTRKSSNTASFQAVLVITKNSSAKVFIKRTAEEWQAFSQKFYLEGKDCCWCHEFYSSLEFVFSGKDARGKKPFEINDRYVLD